MEGQEKLLSLDVNGFTEKKGKLTYLSWANGWKEFLKVYPDATYKVLKNEDGTPIFGNNKFGYMVYTEVTANNITREMWLFVMDGANKSMKDEAYKYTTKYGEKSVEAMSMFDVNKTVMRCLTKNLAMFGLGLYIYAGEDLPEDNTPVDPKAIVTEITTKIVRSYLGATQFAESIELKKMKEALNKKELLPNQYLVDELIKEYGSLNA